MRRFLFPVLLVFTLAITVLAYSPGLTGTFVFDDGPNITLNSNLAITDLSLESLKKAAFSGWSGPLQRPISMLSFAVNRYFTGLDPYYFKITNVGIHALNGIGLFLLTSLLLRAFRNRFKIDLSSRHIEWIGLAVAAAWLLHPFNLTSVLYVVQRMTSLSALFGICALALYVAGRLRLDRDDRGIWHILAALLIFTPLSVLSKENGVLLPLLMLVIEASIFRFRTANATGRRFLIVLFSVTVALPALAFVVYIAMHPSWLLGGYVTRPFTLSERLMTEARVLWMYIRMILLPINSAMGLYHDDIPVSTHLLQPATTLLSIIGIAALAATAFICRNRAPVATFGILFFLCGHAIESTVFPLEITYEHRNYLPMYGLIFIAMHCLLYPLTFKDTVRLRQAGAALLIVLFAFGTFSRSTKWANPFDLAESEAVNHPNSSRSNGELATIYASIETKDPNAAEMNYLSARYHYEKAVRLNPDYTNALFGLIVLSANRNKPIEPQWIDTLADRLAHGHYALDTGNQLMSLVACQSKNTCKLSKTDMERILNAPMNNPTMSTNSRALTLSARSFYLVNVAHDYSAAAAAMQEAVKAAPHQFEYRLMLVQFLTAVGRKEEAKKELAALKQLDKMQLYGEQIAEQDTLLSEASR